MGKTLKAAPIINLFIDAGKTVGYGAMFLRMHCISIPFLSFSFLFMSFFQATKENSSALFLSVARKGVIDIPMMFLLDLIVPMYRVIVCQPVIDIVTAFCAALMFIKWRQKEKKKY